MGFNMDIIWWDRFVEYNLFDGQDFVEWKAFDGSMPLKEVFDSLW